MSATTTRPRHPGSPGRRGRRAAGDSSAPRDAVHTPDTGSTRGGWRVALRMARREVRRHRGRSVIVALMVALPTALMIFAVTIYATSNSEGAERIAPLMGSGAALVSPPQPTALIQDGASDTFYGDETPATPIDGYDESAGARANAPAIAALVGGGATAVPVTSADLPVRLDVDLTRRFSAMVTDAGVGLGAKAELLSGRWASGPGEVVVTPSGIARGLRADGTLTVVTDAGDTTLTVVGTAMALTRWGARLDMVASEVPAGLAADQGSWVIKRNTPVTLNDVLRLGEHGLQVISAELLAHPAPTAELPPALRDQTVFETQQSQMLVATGGLILLITIALLVAPAFAVSAARQRRTLALAASNGATTRQLRTTVLAQAIVLGLAAALSGALVGLAAAYLLAWWGNRPSQPYGMGPFDIPVLAVVLITGLAVVAALIAALAPARRLGRLDIVGVMKGQNVSPPASRRLPLIGLTGVGAGGALLVWAVATRQRELPVAIGMLVLVLGALALVPMALVLVGHLAARLPVSLRMATRDTARQRSRSVPAIAAVMGAVAALTTVGIALTSDTQQRQDEYVPTNVAGQGLVEAPAMTEGVWETVTRTISEVDAELKTFPTGALGEQDWENFDPSAPVEFVVAVPAGCTVERALNDEEFWQDQQAAAEPVLGSEPSGAYPVSPCQRLGTTGSGQFTRIITLDAQALVERFGLTGAQAQLVMDGGAVVGDPEALDDGRLVLTRGSYLSDPDTYEMTDVTSDSTVSLPAVSVPITRQNMSLFLGQTGAIVAESALPQDWAGTPTQRMLVVDPAGPISEVTETALEERLGDDIYFYVERGFQRDDALVMGILVGVFMVILLVVTLTSTALTMAEQRREDATLAAVGATRGTRRAMAAAQSVVTSGVGAVLGFVVGFFPGVAFTYPLTSQSWDALTGEMVVGTPVIKIPWLWLVAVALGVPLVAAALSAVSVRQAPLVTRRTG